MVRLLYKNRLTRWKIKLRSWRSKRICISMGNQNQLWKYRLQRELFWQRSLPSTHMKSWMILCSGQNRHSRSLCRHQGLKAQFCSRNKMTRLWKIKSREETPKCRWFWPIIMKTTISNQTMISKRKINQCLK